MDLSPFGQLFWSPEDLTTPPDEHGNRLIHCTPISDTEEARTIYKVQRLLQKLRLPLP